MAADSEIRRFDSVTFAQVSRRNFLARTGRASLAAGLASQLPVLLSLTGCERAAETFSFFTSAEARTMRAVAARIIPSEAGHPGAEEAGAVYSIDRLLTRPLYAAAAPIVRGGLAELDIRARAAGGRGGFASLSAREQVAIMRELERAPFFEIVRTLVVVGTLAESSYGGNRGGAGWAMIGFTHRPSYMPPFGWYDAQAASASMAGGAR
jgi:gluconate 2-dehydrogenase gamma chain